MNGQPAVTLPASIDAFLRSAGFTSTELATLLGNQVIARVESTGDTGEIVTVGAVIVPASREQTAAYFGQFTSYVDGQVTLGFGKFTNPPTLDNVQSLTLDKGDIDAIRSCKPRDCDVQLTGEGLQKLRASIDWKAPDAAARVQAAARQSMVDYVAAYMQRGDDALVTYADGSTPKSLKAEWRGILANSKYFQSYDAPLREYLLNFPNASLPGGQDIFYWINENYGLKPTISVVHTVVYQVTQPEVRTTIAQKQIYASHYLAGSLAISNLYELAGQDRPMTLVVYANRSRGDLLKGGFGGVKRKVARDQAKTATVDTLTTIQTQLAKASH